MKNEDCIYNNKLSRSIKKRRFYTIGNRKTYFSLYPSYNYNRSFLFLVIFFSNNLNFNIYYQNDYWNKDI